MIAVREVRLPGGMPVLVALAVLVMAVTGCSSSGGGGGGDDPVNHAPTITTSSLSDALEDVLYEPAINAADADGDDLNFTLVEGPTGMTITKTGKYTAKLSMTADDSLSGDGTGASHTVKIRVEDGSAMAEKTYTLKIINTEDLSFEVYDAENGGALPNVEITLDDGAGHVYTAETDFLGHTTMDNVRSGSFDSKLEHLATTHETYLPGTFKVSKTDNTTAKAVMYDRADSDFVTDTIRENGAVRKWKTKPIIAVYTKRADNSDVPVAELNTFVDTVLKGRINQFKQNSFTDFDTVAGGGIEYRFTSPVAGYEAGTIKVAFNNLGTGMNNSQVTDNEITAGVVSVPEGDLAVQLAETTAAFLGGAETNDGAYTTSVLCSPATATVYSSKDAALSDLVYDLDFQRPAGNKDEGTPGRRDVNPSDYQWNQTLTAPTSCSKPSTISPATTCEYDDCPDDETYSTPCLPAKEVEVF